MRLTYMIGGEGKRIQCLDCGAISWNLNDVRQRYCGHCHEFHDHKEVKVRVREHFDQTPAEEVVANMEAIRGEERNG